MSQDPISVRAIGGSACTDCTAAAYYSASSEVWLSRRGSNSGIAMELFVSASIAKVHLVPICSKLGVNDRTAAVAAAFVPWVIRLDRWLGRCGGGSEVG